MEQCSAPPKFAPVVKSKKITFLTELFLAFEELDMK